MNIDFNKISTIYGEELLSTVKENINDINNNINYMHILGFNDIEDIFERLTPLFIEDKNIFINKLDNLIKELGSNYVDIIENDLSILEELL